MAGKIGARDLFRRARGGSGLTITPYAASVAVALISGIRLYLTAKKNCDAGLKGIAEQNRHDTERLVKQREVDVSRLKETLRLELKKMDVEHKYALEFA